MNIGSSINHLKLDVLKVPKFDTGVFSQITGLFKLNYWNNNDNNN